MENVNNAAILINDGLPAEYHTLTRAGGSMAEQGLTVLNLGRFAPLTV